MLEALEKVCLDEVDRLKHNVVKRTRIHEDMVHTIQRENKFLQEELARFECKRPLGGEKAVVKVYKAKMEEDRDHAKFKAEHFQETLTTSMTMQNQ